MLENRNNELNNEKKDLEEERDRLKMMLRGLNKSSLRILTSGLLLLFFLFHFNNSFFLRKNLFIFVLQASHPNTSESNISYIVCLFFLPGQSDGASSQKCPADWREINSRCYFLSSEQKTWGESRKYCQRNGSDLVVIDSEQEQVLIFLMVKNSYILYYLNLNRLHCTVWMGILTSCSGLMYHFNPLKANWNDAPCGQKRRWLCETDQSTSS
uniref:C-type lectin domain-containing protein n=1 Tax=Seriola lalandi dorsalis TaxID=1841481 RepID=A0A3B4Z5Y4_SERLL